MSDQAGNEVRTLHERASGLLSSGRIDEAAAICARITELDPNDAGAYTILGHCFLARRDPRKAEAPFRKAIEVQPRLPNLHYNLGLALSLQGRTLDALGPYEKAVELDPDSPAPNAKLGQTLLQLGRTCDAIPYLKKSVLLDADSRSANLSLGQALIEAGWTVEAETYVRRSLAIDSKDWSAHSALGRILQQEGRFEEAIKSFRSAIQRDPRQPAPYFGLAYSKRISEDDLPIVRQMESLLRSSLPPKGRSLLSYSLGKSYDDLGSYEDAIRHFDEANRIELEERARAGIAFNPSRLAAQFDGMIETFTPDFFRRHAEKGERTDLPILIVGMIRSGTTLVEQILSSHPQIAAAGELPFWRDRGASLAQGSNLEGASEVAAEYAEILRAVGASSRHVTDKMPLNFMAIGIIHLLFPRARIVHCRRHPIDNCLSVYATPYRGAPEFAHNRADIVFAYQQYERLMNHWREVLPEGTLFDVAYEQLVADREAVTRKMVGFLGLEWNDACLAPEQNPNRVATPSQWQVRQPIYRSSVGRWTHYQPWLREFEGLGIPNP